MYHNSGAPFACVPEYDILTPAVGDLSRREGYDFEQMHAIAKVEVRRERVIP